MTYCQAKLIWNSLIFFLKNTRTEGTTFLSKENMHCIDLCMPVYKLPVKLLSSTCPFDFRYFFIILNVKKEFTWGGFWIFNDTWRLSAVRNPSTKSSIDWNLPPIYDYFIRSLFVAFTFTNCSIALDHLYQKSILWSIFHAKLHYMTTCI